MSLASRFGFGRRAREVGLAGDPAAPVPAEPKGPTVRNALPRTTKPTRQTAVHAPYASRYDESPDHLNGLDRLGLSQKERELAAKLFGDDVQEKAREVIVPRPLAVKAPRKKLDRGDLTLGALGVTLALICALFPWYIFFNQEKFGVREFVFEGRGTVTAPSDVAYQPSLVGQHFQTGDVPKMDLDFFPTATPASEDERVRAVPASEQPFPSDLVNFRLVHVANGRAMIQDDDGLWVVQPGSSLPDASKVTAIEQRGGKWVLVTNHDAVVEMQP